MINSLQIMELDNNKLTAQNSAMSWEVKLETSLRGSDHNGNINVDTVKIDITKRTALENI